MFAFDYNFDYHWLVMLNEEYGIFYWHILTYLNEADKGKSILSACLNTFSCLFPFPFPVRFPSQLYCGQYGDEGGDDIMVKMLLIKKC